MDYFKQRLNQSVDNRKPDLILANSAVDMSKGNRVLAVFEHNPKKELPKLAIGWS